MNASRTAIAALALAALLGTIPILGQAAQAPPADAPAAIRAVAAGELKSGTLREAAALLPGGSPETDRRQVTVVFADLSGFTAVSGPFSLYA